VKMDRKCSAALQSSLRTRSSGKIPDEGCQVGGVDVPSSGVVKSPFENSLYGAVAFIPHGASRADQVVGDAPLTEAEFQGGARVQVRSNGPGRWCLWVNVGSAWHRRKDSATPHFDHARRIAEHWFGKPTAGWHAASDG
jgi:hypothetical protein